MKKSFLNILTIAMIAFSMSLLVSCGGSKTETTEEETVAAVYACPMHPEVKGKEGDTCGECGMALEKVEEQEGEHMNH
ncbi:MAG: hypothetical protein KDC99_16890 [Cyclobacteriaceae bacterium]|nr:hypothetical protein [Cyclobacteriaceae bacterium]